MTTTQFRDHPVRIVLKQLQELQNRSEFSEPSVIENEQYSFARDKAFAITALVEARLAETPAILASTTALNTLHSNLQSPLNELNAFLHNKNAGHIVNAAAQFEGNVLPHLWGLPIYSPQGDFSALSAAITQQVEFTSGAIAQLSDLKVQLASDLNGTINEVQELHGQLDQLKESAAKERAEASAAVASLQQQYNEKEIERASAFAQELANSNEQFSQVLDKAQLAAQERLAELDRLRAEASQIVQVVGNIGVTGNYQRIANSESGQANTWRFITIGIFGCGIAVAAATFIKFWDQPVSPENLWSVAVRLLYAIAITAPAWYTARESARHRTNADRARQTELELASIGPFIELMPEEKKIEIKEALTKSYFGRPIDAHDIQTPLDALQVKDLVVELAKALKK